MLRLIALIGALGGTGLLAGCADLITGGELIRDNGPTGYLEVVNGTAGPFDVVMVSACDVGSYGMNRLPGGVSIPPGGSYDFEVSAGCWDVDAGAWGVGDATHRLDVAAGGVSRLTITDD